MVQEDLTIFTIPIDRWKKVADLTELPTAGDGTNMGRVAGVHGTNTPALHGSGLATLAITEKARHIFTLPECYVAGQSITFRIRGEASALPDVSYTIDLEAYKSDREQGVSADLCTTAAQSLTTSWANYDFVITPTGLVAGDELDLELTHISDDTGGAPPAHNFYYAHTAILLDIKG